MARKTKVAATASLALVVLFSIGILIRLSAFILLAIGVQIMSNGIRSEFPGLLGPIHNQISRLSSEGQSRNQVMVSR